MSTWRGVIEEYRAFLPLLDGIPAVTLHEGNTPLIHAPRLAEALGINATLYLKYEAMNPTASFKDRGMVAAMAMAKHKRAKAVVCASTGNTSASAAAYAARLGMKSLVIVPAGKIAQGKLAQALMYGADLVPIEGNFDDALRLVRELEDHPHIEVVNSINPLRIEGQKTASFELCDALGRAPDYHFLPVGNAGNITAYWKGFCEYHSAGKVSTRPKMIGWQASGAAPIVDGKIVNNPQTIATAIRIGNPASWQGAIQARDESGGHIGKVTDEEILYAYRLLASTEGVFVEPACAAPVAGLLKIKDSLPSQALITLTLTGHGLKDPTTALEQTQTNLNPVPAKLDAVLERAGI